MKKRTIIWFFVAGSAIGLVLLAFRGCSNSGTNSQELLPERGRDEDAENSRQVPNQGISKAEAFGLLPVLTSNPIKFFGRVVDQDNRPLSSVRVIGKTGSKTGFMSEEHRTYETTTDENGDFVFKGFSGSGLGVELEKEGYLYKRVNRTYNFSSFTSDRETHSPDPNQPEVFQMWEQSGAEPMIHYRKVFYDLPIDGTPVEVDLVEGKKVGEHGDLQVQVWCDPSNPKSFSSDWKAAVAIPRGGLIEESRDQAFHAPEAGYASKIDYIFDGQPPTSSLIKTYIAKIDNGRAYARVRLTIQNSGMDANFVLTVTVWLNPTDSRNLEYDPMLSFSVK